jgi:hypothetical protein
LHAEPFILPASRLTYQKVNIQTDFMLTLRGGAEDNPAIVLHRGFDPSQQKAEASIENSQPCLSLLQSTGNQLGKPEPENILRSESMRRTCLTKPARIIAGLLTAMLFAVVTLQPSAQTAADSRAQHPLVPAYDKAHEITLNGMVQEVVTKHIAGSPFGMHLMVAGPEGMVDAHVGPYLSKDVQEALHAGLPLQIVGAVEEHNGKSFLLARQLIFGGRTVTVRSENGFLVRARASRVARSRPDNRNAKTTQKGESL